MAANFNVHPHVANFFYGYQPENLWYLLFDYNRRDLGPAGFDKSRKEKAKEGDEREVGYLSGMFSGFDYVLATIDEPLSRNYLRDLHSRALSMTVEEMHGGDYRDPFMPNLGYNVGVISSGLTVTGPRRNVTLAGLKGLRDKIRNGDNYFRIIFKEDETHITPLVVDRLLKSGLLAMEEETLYEHKGHMNNSLEALKRDDLSDEEFFKKVRVENTAVIIRVACSQADLFRRLDSIIDLFHQEMTAPQISEEGKIRAIAICLHEILLTHPFPDGNGRTMALLLNKLLLQYNLCPAILMNPTIIDAFSIKQLSAAIGKGQYTFKICYRRPYFGPGKVIFLKNNPNVTALFIYTAVAAATQWDTINVGDRKGIMNLFLAELCSTISMTIEQIKDIKIELRQRVRDATYERGRFGFFSNAGNMFSEVARNAIYGKYKEAVYLIFDGNKYGIDFRILAGNSKGYKNNHSSSNDAHPRKQRMEC